MIASVAHEIPAAHGGASHVAGGLHDKAAGGAAGAASPFAALLKALAGLHESPTPGVGAPATPADELKQVLAGLGLAPEAEKESEAEPETAASLPVDKPGTEATAGAALAAATAQAAATAVGPKTATAEGQPAAEVTESATPAPEAAQPAATATVSKPAQRQGVEQSFQWNVSELRYQLRAALEGREAQPGEPVATAPAADDAAVLEQSESGSAPVIEPVIELADAALEPAVEMTAKQEAASGTVATAPATTLEWAPEPVRAAGGERMPGLIDQVRQASEWMAERAEGAIRAGERGVEANMRLYPPDLGGVRVEMTVGHDLAVEAKFTVERPETALAIRQQLGQLEQALARQGLVVGKVQVTVAPVSAAAQGQAASGENPGSFARREPATDGQPRRQEGRPGGRQQQSNNGRNG